MFQKYATLLVLLLLVLRGLLLGVNVDSFSITADENAHYKYGVRCLKGKPARIDPLSDDSKMPLSALNTLPRAIEQVLHPSLKRDDGGVRDIKNGRYITILLSTLIGWLIWLWANALWGARTGLFCVLVFAICPNFLAHSGLVTTDIYSALGIFSTMYFLHKWIEEPHRWKWVLWLGLCLGFAQISKNILLFLYPLCGIVVAIYWRRFSSLSNVFLKTMLAFCLSLCVVNIGFSFYEFGKPLSDYVFLSDTFRSLQTIPILSEIPLPLATPFLSGIDLVHFFEQIGTGCKTCASPNYPYILGKHNWNGFGYYYIVLLGIKTPLPILFFALSGMVLLFRKRQFGQDSTALIILLPLVFFGVYLSFFNKIQIGFRHFLIVLPFLYLATGYFFQRISAYQYANWGLFIGFMWSLLSVGQYYPDFIPYSNELIIAKKDAYRYMGDSNLSFGEGKYFLAKFLLEHPEIQEAPETAQNGIFIIETNHLLTQRGHWLLAYSPEAHFRHNYLIFRIENLPKTE